MESNNQNDESLVSKQPVIDPPTDNYKERKISPTLKLILIGVGVFVVIIIAFFTDRAAFDRFKTNIVGTSTPEISAAGEFKTGIERINDIRVSTSTEALKREMVLDRMAILKLDAVLTQVILEIEWQRSELVKVIEIINRAFALPASE